MVEHISCMLLLRTIVMIRNGQTNDCSHSRFDKPIQISFFFLFLRFVSGIAFFCIVFRCVASFHYSKLLAPGAGEQYTRKWTIHVPSRQRVHVIINFLSPNGLRHLAQNFEEFSHCCYNSDGVGGDMFSSQRKSMNSNSHLNYSLSILAVVIATCWSCLLRIKSWIFVWKRILMVRAKSSW